MSTVIQLKPSKAEMATVKGGRSKNADYRSREYLTEKEIDKLVAAAGESRNPGRDRLLILMAFRHALRVSELVDLRWQQVHLDSATIDIRRAKNGTPGIHGLQGDELRLLRALRREHPHADFVFLSERKAPLSIDGAQKLIERLGESAALIVQAGETLGPMLIPRQQIKPPRLLPRRISADQCRRSQLEELPPLKQPQPLP